MTESLEKPQCPAWKCSSVFTGHMAPPNISTEYCLGAVSQMLFVGFNLYLPSSGLPVLSSSLPSLHFPVASLSSGSSGFSSLPSLMPSLTALNGVS